MYGGLSIVFFMLVLFLQGVAGFSALAAGSASVPVTLVMFVLAARFGKLADRYGPRWFMGAGPLICAAGLALMLRLDADVTYWTDLLPALLVFALGLSIVVAPLTATVLSDADEHNAGIASAVNNAIARVAGLVAIAAIGALVAGQYGSRLDDALGPSRHGPGSRARWRRCATGRSPSSARPAWSPRSPTAWPVRSRRRRWTPSTSASAIAVVLVGLGGVLGLVGIRNPRRAVAAEHCAGGQFVGVPEEASHQSPCDWHRERPVVAVPVREPAT